MLDKADESRSLNFLYNRNTDFEGVYQTRNGL